MVSNKRHLYFGSHLMFYSAFAASLKVLIVSRNDFEVSVQDFRFVLVVMAQNSAFILNGALQSYIFYSLKVAKF